MKKTVKEMLADLEAATMQAIWIPNELLPESYQDNREGGRTLERVANVYEKEVEPALEYQRVKAAKAKRLAQYAADYAEAGKFTYDVDDDLQYKNEQSFCDGLIAGGILDSDDFMEQNDINNYVDTDLYSCE